MILFYYYLGGCCKVRLELIAPFAQDFSLSHEYMSSARGTNLLLYINSKYKGHKKMYHMI